MLQITIYLNCCSLPCSGKIYFGNNEEGEDVLHEKLFDVVHWNRFAQPRNNSSTDTTVGQLLLPRLVRYHPDEAYDRDFNITTYQWNNVTAKAGDYSNKATTSRSNLYRFGNCFSLSFEFIESTKEFTQTRQSSAAEV